MLDWFDYLVVLAVLVDYWFLNQSSNIFGESMDSEEVIESDPPNLHYISVQLVGSWVGNGCKLILPDTKPV
jgi:hypothetical protein